MVKIPYVFLVVAVALLFGIDPLTSLRAQRIAPDAPVKNFKLPGFGPDGFRQWDLEGREGRYIDSGEIEIIGLRLRTWSGGEELSQVLEITSPEAHIFPDKNRAVGSGLIHIVGPGYTVFGVGWDWNGETNAIAVEHEVRVTFLQDLDILK